MSSDATPPSRIASAAAPRSRVSTSERTWRALELALFASAIIHGLAMVGTALLLLPMLPGGGADDAARLATIVAHPLRFRIGWVPWHASAISDLALSLVLVRVRAVPRALAFGCVALTLVAVACDQTGQALWLTRGLELARAAVATGDTAAYFRYEAFVFPLTGAWAAALYTAVAILWSFELARAGLWSRTLTIVSLVAWSVFAIASAGPLLPAPLTLPLEAAGAANALGFVLLEAWFALVIEQVMRERRPDTRHGRWAPWRAPGDGLASRALELAANSRVLRATFSAAPAIEIDSDIEDVVYVNYLVDAARLEPFVAEGLELQRVGPAGAHAVFSMLTYRHGHFGPALLGSMRRLLPSPVQSNWRTYVRDPRTKREGIYFVTNCVTSAAYAIGARIVAEGMPMHLLARGSVTKDGHDAISVRLDAGRGTAPDLDASLAVAALRELPEAWRACFDDYDAMLAHVVPQDRALSTLPWRRETARAEIDLGIPLAACVPLEGRVASRAAEAIVGDAAPLCFLVRAVAFRFTQDARDPW
jgi:hypothetical protein